MVVPSDRGERDDARRKGALSTKASLVALAALLALACGSDPRPPVDADGGNGGAAETDGGKATGGSATQAGASSAGDSGSEGGSAGAELGGAGAGQDSGGSSGAGGSGGAGGSAGSSVVPEPGRPGFGMVGVGNYSTSANYRLVGGVGDSPGANLVSRSTNYTLHGGLVGTTQP
jgi:hypothetical protein